jgi:AraC-like DNA-binding protein
MPLNEIKPRIVFQTSSGSPLGRIALAGLLKQHAGVPEKPMRTLGNYALVYLLNGEGTFKDANGTHFKVKPGDLWLIFPEIPHWYGPTRGSLWDEFYIVFSGPIFDLWRSKGLLNPSHPARQLQPVDYWLRRLQEVVVTELDPLQQVCSLQHLLAEILEATDSSIEPQWLAKARHLLQTEEDGVDKVSRSLGMSYETFRKRFAAAAGVSPGFYQTTKLIDKACALMVAGTLTNKEIAERLDFCDEFHFSRRFKKIMGLTPTQFRLKMPQKV